MSNVVVQPGDDIPQELKDWVVNIEARLDNSTEDIPPTTTRPPNGKIPSIYGNWKCLDDHVPFSPKINMWQFVACMKNCYNLNVQSYLKDLQEKEDELWSYYEGVDQQFRAENGKRFIEYLLANSCFLIFPLVILSYRQGVLKKFRESAKNDGSKMETILKCQRLIVGEILGILRYMLTMDYQIPWFVVEAVYTKHSNVSSKLNTPIHELVMSTFDHFINPGVPKSKLHNNTITVPRDGFQHLLHILHWSRTPQGKFHDIIPGDFNVKSLYIPCATDLQSRAAVFNEHSTSGFDVTFNERILSGVMQLPTFSRFLYENEIYKDLLAFERGYGRVCGFSVTSYIACIVSLVQTEEDVGLLQVNDLLPNEKKDLILKSVQGYKTILHSNDTHVSNDLYNMWAQISHFHLRSSTKYYADFKRRYCSNPWITLSVVGATLLFVLTFIQTVLSFIQTKYSVLSYKNQ